MKNKIALKLTFYFAAALLIFALVVGSSFRVLFWQHTEALKKAELEQRAVKIAQAMVDTREQVIAWQERMVEMKQDRQQLEELPTVLTHRFQCPLSPGLIYRIIASYERDKIMRQPTDL